MYSFIVAQVRSKFKLCRTQDMLQYIAALRSLDLRTVRKNADADQALSENIPVSSYCSMHACGSFVTDLSPQYMDCTLIHCSLIGCADMAVYRLRRTVCVVYCHRMLALGSSSLQT